MRNPQLWTISWFALTITFLMLVGSAESQYGMTDGQWTAYSGDKGSTKYSTLDQINRDNVVDLQIAWRWNSPDNATKNGAPRGNKITPLYIDGVLYMNSMYAIVSAIDPSSGETIWVFDPEVWNGRRPGNLGWNARGLAYWSDGQGDDRIILATQRNKMYAINAHSGKLIERFGNNGVVDLIKPYRRRVNSSFVYAISPAMVVGDVIVIGRAISDVPTTKEMPPGDVFGFDVRTGALKWTFFNPPKPDQVGYDTWKEGSADYTGNANVWTHMSADEELGLVYLPFGTPTDDWYGGHRKGDGLFAESLVAVHAETGKLAWYFQHVHHGVWDYDLPTAPALINVTVDGNPVKALAQATKQGFLWVLDRTNGEPLWPIEERPVPQSNVEGEETSPTQPFPTKPGAYNLQGSIPENLIDYTPELKAEALDILKQYNYGPLYTPPMAHDQVNAKKTLNNPGWGGGAMWMGVAADPDTGIVYVPSISGKAQEVILVRPDPERSNLRYVGRVQLGGTVAGPRGLPLFKGPYSRVTAIDVNTGDHLWQIPIGDGPANHPELAHLNLGPLGGGSYSFPLLTKTLLFIFNNDQGKNVRAVDKNSGELIAELSFKGRVSGTPMTFAHEGKQYIAMPIAGGRNDLSGLVALSLP